MGSGTLANQLAGIVAYLDQSIRAAGQFVAEQAPDVVREVLAWNFWSSLLGFIAGVAFIAASLFVTILAFLYFQRKNKGNYDEGVEWVTWALGCLPVVSGLLIASNNMDWLKILIAPKLFLLEYAASFIK